MGSKVGEKVQKLVKMGQNPPFLPTLDPFRDIDKTHLEPILRVDIVIQKGP